MAKQSLKAQIAEMEDRLTMLHNDYLSLKRKNTKLTAWVHTHGGDVNEIIAESEKAEEFNIF